MVTAPPASARPRAAPRPGRTETLLVAIVLIAAVLRLTTLGAQSYWIDEATTVFEAHRSLGGLFHELHVNESSPPLYFLIVWVWARAFGTGEFALRLFSALCGIATIPAIFACGRQLVSRRLGLVAAGLAAVSPFLVYYSQEARAYALFALLSSLALGAWLRAVRSPSRTAVMAWGACGALAVLTHFFAGFLLAPQAVYLLARRRDRTTLLACTAVALVQCAVLPLALEAHHHQLGWISQFPFATRLQQIPVQFALGQLYASPVVSYGLSGTAVMAVAVGLLVGLGGDRLERRAGVTVATLAGCVILIPVALALAGSDYVVPRNLIGAWTPLILLVALAGLAPRARFAGALLLAAVAAMFLWADVQTQSHAKYQRPPWRGVAAALGRASARRAVVATDATFATEPLSIYLPQASYLPPPPQPMRVSELDLVSRTDEQLVARLPAGLRLVAARTVGDLHVWRLTIARPWLLTPDAITLRGLALLTPRPWHGGMFFQAPGPRHLA